MSALSKLTSSLHYNCYEIAHPWTTSCSHAWSYLFISSLKESGKIYGALYLVRELKSWGFLVVFKFLRLTENSTAACVEFAHFSLFQFAQLVLARKISLEAFLQTFQSASRSTVFLSYNVFFFLFFICIFRWVINEASSLRWIDSSSYFASKIQIISIVLINHARWLPGRLLRVCICNKPFSHPAFSHPSCRYSSKSRKDGRCSRFTCSTS